MSAEQEGRRDIVNRLREHQMGPMSDDVRARLTAALESEEAREKRRPWQIRLRERLRGK